MKGLCILIICIKKTSWYLGQYIANGYMSLKTSLSIHCIHGPSRQILVLNLLMCCINNHHSAFQGQKFLIPVYLCLQCTIMRCLSFLHNNLFLFVYGIYLPGFNKLKVYIKLWSVPWKLGVSVDSLGWNIHDIELGAL